MGAGRSGRVVHTYGLQPSGWDKTARLAVSLGYVVTPCLWQDYKQEATYNFNCLVALLWKVSKTWSAVSKRKTKDTCCVGSLWGRASDALGFHDHMNLKTTSNEAQQIYPVISKVKQIIYLLQSVWLRLICKWCGKPLESGEGHCPLRPNPVIFPAFVSRGICSWNRNWRLMESGVSSRALQRQGVHGHVDTDLALILWSIPYFLLPSQNPERLTCFPPFYLIFFKKVSNIPLYIFPIPSWEFVKIHLMFTD